MSRMSRKKHSHLRKTVKSVKTNRIVSRVISILCILGLVSIFPMISGKPLFDPDDYDIQASELDEPVNVPVEVFEISKQYNTEFIKYIGILQPLEMRNKTYSGIAEIETIYVEEGQPIQVGDELVKIDTSNSEEQLATQRQAMNQAYASRSSAYQEMKAAQLSMEQANSIDHDAELAAAEADLNAKRTIYEIEKAKYDQAVIDYENGTITEAEYNDALASYTSAEAEYRSAQASYQVTANTNTSIDRELAAMQYQAAKSRYEAADANYDMQRLAYEQLEQTIAEGTLTSDIDGYVVQILAKEGELANPLIPIMVIGTHDTVVTIGTSQNDIRSIRVGQPATISIGSLDFEGAIHNISKVPDETSRTYETNISFPHDEYDFFIGETATVEIETGTVAGIWIPIQVILNDGQDYVYVIENQRAVKRYIEMGSLSNDRVLVDGLNIGDYIVSEGIKNIKSGTLVEVTNLDIEPTPEPFGPENITD